MVMAAEQDEKGETTLTDENILKVSERFENDQRTFLDSKLYL